LCIHYRYFLAITMDFIEITFSTAIAGGVLSELLPYWLENLNFEGFYESESGLKAYIPVIAFNKSEMEERIRQKHGKDIPFTENLVPDKNWNEEWERNYNPVVIDDICLVRAPFHSREKQYPYEIVLEPKMSFGTGHHETTSLMISEILKIDLTGSTVLDAGCGTGILAILAELKGATRIRAVDFDIWCYRNATENILKNSCNKIEVINTDVMTMEEGQYDCILANLNIGILKNALGKFENQLNSGGNLIISGILTGDAEGLISESKETALELITNASLNIWALLRFKKK
jgi:ribosomal protein L11 methyltransferase